MVYIITTWYKRFEVQKRLALFYLISILISSFSSIAGMFLTIFYFASADTGLQSSIWNYLFERKRRPKRVAVDLLARGLANDLPRRPYMVFYPRLS